LCSEIFFEFFTQKFLPIIAVVLKIHLVGRL